jgi:amidohydrolase
MPESTATSDALILESIGKLDPASISEEFAAFLSRTRRHLHQNPEIGFAEHNTSRYIRKVLEDNGLKVSAPVATTGLFVDIQGNHPGPLIAYRADIDALPIQDAKSAAYTSTVKDVAHLCGHDAHTTLGIGIAITLYQLRHLIHGSIRIFFQPNEEGIPSGAPLMIDDGVMENVTAVYASHVDPTLPTGCYGLIVGPSTASADRFRVRVRAATTGHSARPHQATDTIWIASQILNALYQQIGRINDARNGTVFTVCRFLSGEAYNVIPSVAEFGGTYRCTHHDDRATLKMYIVKTAEQIAGIHDASVEVDFDHGSPPVVNDKHLISIVRNALLETVGEDAIFDIPVPSMGAEDFAHYLDHAPGMLLRVGTCDGPATSHTLHDSLFDIDEASLAPTVALMSRVLIQTLQTGGNGRA